MDNTTLTIQKTDSVSEALRKNNFDAILVDTKEEALEKIKNLIPKGKSIMNGASKTLEEIGFIDYLKSGDHGWNNLHEAIILEKDPEKQSEMRKQSVLSDYYLGSVHALTENGELVIASNTGSQLPHLVFTSQNVILVVSTKKITKTLSDAWERLKNHVIPLEDERMKSVYGFGTSHTKTLIMHKENPAMGRSVKIILVNEDLGF